MIRTYRMNGRLPRAEILSCVDQQSGKISLEWRQITVFNENLKALILRLAPPVRKLTPRVMIHTTSQGIERHIDGLSKTVFVIPVRYGKKTALAVKQQSVAFQPGLVYRFNDFHEHGIENPNRAHLVLITISFDMY